MKKFYTIKLSTKQSFLDGYKKKTTPTRPLNDLLEEGFLDEHVYYDGCSTRSGSDFEKILIVITSPVTSFAVTLSAPPDTRRHSMLTVPFDAEDVEILGPNFMRLRDGSIFTADEHGYSWVSWSVELSAEERTARNSKVTAMTSAATAKAVELLETGNKRQTAKKPKSAGAKPKYGKKEESIFKRWITYSKSGGTKKDFWNDPKWGLNNSMGLDDLKKLIAGVGRKNNGEYKARHVKRIS